MAEKRYDSLMRKISRSPQETGKIAGWLAKKIVRIGPCQKAVVVALEGELGAGKTTFIKGFAKALDVKEKITSPTFVIMKNWKLETVNWKLLTHVDAYRLKDEKDLARLGIKEIFANPQNIVLIEWADRVRKILPERHIKIHMDHVSEKRRRVNIKF